MIIADKDPNPPGNDAVFVAFFFVAYLVRMP
jgi:hypothetical protein